jgi:signal peptidase
MNLHRILKLLAAMAVVAIVLPCIAVVVAPRFGWSVNIVSSGSMEPALKVRSLVIFSPVDPATVKVGDIIAYELPTDPSVKVTHRVVEVIDQGDYAPAFSTKGDANEEPDIYTVPAQDVVGRVVTTIPYIGYVKEPMSTRLGIWLLIGVPATLIVLMELWAIISAIGEARRDEAWIAMLLEEDEQPKRRYGRGGAKLRECDDDPIWTLEVMPRLSG